MKKKEMTHFNIAIIALGDLVNMNMNWSEMAMDAVLQKLLD